MESIPPTKKPFNDPNDPYFNKNLHHHHLGPEFTPSTYDSSSNINYNRSSPPFPYYSSYNSRPVSNGYLPFESRPYPFSPYRNMPPERNQRAPPLNIPPERNQMVPPLHYNGPSIDYDPQYYPTPNYVTPPISYAPDPYHSYTLPYDPIRSVPFEPMEYETPQFVDYEAQGIPYEYEDSPMRRSGQQQSFPSLEYVPFERKYVDHIPVEKIEYVPVERTDMDYYAVEKKMEYMPVPRYETKVEYVPRQVVDHIPQTYVEYVPVKRKDLVPVERLQERVEYQPVDKSFLHYPQVDKQFANDAEKSGRIRSDLVGTYYPAQVVDHKPSKFGQNNVCASYIDQKDGNMKKSLDLSCCQTSSGLQYNSSSYANGNNKMPPNYYGNNPTPPNYYGNNPTPPNYYGNNLIPPNYYGNNQTPPNYYQTPPTNYGNNPSPYDYGNKNQTPPTNYGNNQTQPNYYGNNQSPPNYYGNNQVAPNYNNYPQQNPNIGNNAYQYANNVNNQDYNNTPAYSRNLEQTKIHKEYNPTKGKNYSDLENLKKQLEGGKNVK